MRVRLTLLAITLITACSSELQQEETRSLFGTTVTVTVEHPRRALRQQALAATFAELDILQRITELPDAKPLSRTNVLLQGGEWFSANPSIYPLLLQGKKIAHRTNGLVDPASLGALRQAWHGQAPNGSVPPAVQAMLRKLPTMAAVEIEGIRVRGRDPRLSLDFDRLAHGYAVDTELTQLRALGIQRASVRVGTVVGQIGADITRPWTVTLPSTETTDTRLRLDSGEAACIVAGDTPAAPLFHPRTGRPAAARAVVVIGVGALDTAAACMALQLAGPDDAAALMAPLGVRAARVVGRDGRVYDTPGFAQRLVAAH
jgi:thiamine biosynthesis lipoprotein